MASGGERICVVIGRTRHKMVAIELKEAAKRGAKLIELRLDFIAKALDFKRLLHDRPCPLIATLRRTKDGGRWSGTEEQRKMLIRQAVVAGFDWVDLETDIADEIRRFRDVKRIISYHNMTETPSDLEAIYERMCEQDPDVVKVACMAQKPSDNARVLALLQKSSQPTVAFCMGDFGQPSRYLAMRHAHVPFMYATFNQERGIAPGMPSYDEVRRIYRPSRVGPHTAVYGVVGDPIGHSLSPLVHNALYRKLGVNALYLPFRVPRHQLPQFIRAYEDVPVSGYSVTIPHKEAAAGLAVAKDATVELTHAANTLKFHPESKSYSASNTDYRAILALLREQQAHDPQSRPPGTPKPLALVAGAGGVGRAVAHALHYIGYHVVVSSRTLDRAEKLAVEVQGKAVDWEARHGANFEIVVNSTPVGMHPDVDETPLHVSLLKPEVLVFDTIYTPETTLLVREARERGCRIITGVDLFVRQAALQFEAFTGETPPQGMMLELVRRALSPLTRSADDD